MSRPLIAPSPSRLNLSQHAPPQHPNNMPPKKTTASPRRKPRENMFFEPGVRGRKTGLTVPDTGIRDEHGIEPMDELFSSPEKAQPIPSAPKSAMKKSPNTTITTEEDMDVGESTIPDPTAVLTERKRVSLHAPLPHSRSPVKTYLGSPARRHPSLGPVSSPTRGSIVSPARVRPQPPVARRLDFSVDDIGANSAPRLAISPPKAAAHRTPIGPSPTSKKMNGLASAPKSLKPAFHSNEDTPGSQQENNPVDLNSSREYNDSFQPLNDDDQGDGSPQPETPPEPIPPRPTKKRGRPSLDKSEPAKRNKVGRPKKINSSTAQAKEHAMEKEDEIRDEHREDEPEPELPPAKRQRIPAKPAKSSQIKQKPPVKAKPKPAVTRQESPPKDSSPIQVQRGPPRPKQNGLFILRRETPALGSFQTTRSGRASVKPVAYWKNEAVVYGEDATADGDASFLLPTIKEVIRREEIEIEKSKKGKKRGRKAQKRDEEDGEDENEEELVEPWESEPGRIYGEIRTWDPEDPIGSETAEVEEEIAYSNAAIVTREIPGSNVKFAKTLTLPFFGSGMVDLPPGAFKKPKNSRKMQMVFFVHYGRVKVEVNGNSFRISKGGIFQVPRGNFYSIENDYDKPARIFFSQGCEVIQSV